jgi:hypothetical protein
MNPAKDAGIITLTNPTSGILGRRFQTERRRCLEQRRGVYKMESYPKQNIPFRNIVRIHFVFWVSVTNNNGFWNLFTITVNYNSSQSMTVSSTVTNHERRIPAHTVNSLMNDVCLTNLWLEFTNELSFTNSRRPKYKSPSQMVPLLFSVIFCSEMYASISLLRNTLLESRCLAMDYSVTISSFPFIFENRNNVISRHWF